MPTSPKLGGVVERVLGAVRNQRSGPGRRRERPPLGRRRSRRITRFGLSAAHRALSSLFRGQRDASSWCGGRSRRRPGPERRLRTAPRTLSTTPPSLGLVGTFPRRATGAPSYSQNDDARGRKRPISSQQGLYNCCTAVCSSQGLHCPMGDEPLLYATQGLWEFYGTRSYCLTKSGIVRRRR